MRHETRFENLDREVVTRVLKEQTELYERMKIDYGYMMTYGPTTSKYSTEMQDLERKMNFTENFIKYLKANGKD